MNTTCNKCMQEIPTMRKCPHCFPWNLWIDIKLKKPTYNTSVLVCNIDGQCYDEAEPQIAYLDDDDKCFYYIAPWNYNLYHKAKVTHWMNLPNIPTDKFEFKETK